MEENDKSRKVLSPEELSHYEKVLSDKINEMIGTYIILLARDSGISISDISKSLDYTEEETLSELASIIGVQDFRTAKESDILKLIPEDYQDLLKEIKKIYLASNRKEELLKLAELQEPIERIEEIKTAYEEKVAEIMSNSDLSQIPAEMYNNLKWLDRVNFEGTGAKLDMNNFGYGTYINGSLKGCELISFNSSKFAKKELQEGSTIKFTNIITPQKDELDRSQYEAVLKGYRGDKYFPQDLLFILEDKDIQANNEWFYNDALQNVDSSYGLTNIWKTMTPEMQSKYIGIFDKIMKLAIEDKNIYILSNAISQTSKDVLEERYEEILQEFIQEDGNLDFSKYCENIWRSFPKETQVKHFDEMVSSYIQDDNEKYDKLWQTTSKEVQTDKMPQLFNNFIDDNGKIEKLYDFFKILEHNKGEMPEECYKQIVELYKGGDSILRSRISGIWHNIGYENQSKNLKSFMQMQKDLGLGKEEIYAIWKSTNATIKFETFDDVVEFVAKNIPEVEHDILGKGYIDALSSLSKEQREEKITENMPKFLFALREKHNDNDRTINRDDDVKYDKKFAQILYDLDRKGILNTENVNVIIDNLPELGEDIINRIYQSNSKMLEKYGTHLITVVAPMKRNDAIATIEEFERIFSQDTLPEFAKLYKYFELVGDKESNAILSSVSQGKRSGLSPVLSNTSSERLGKRIIFSDLMRISMDSNNKSLRKFIDTLETGNKSYIKLLTNNGNKEALSKDEQEKLSAFVKTIYCLYEESAAARIDKSQNKKINLTGDISQDAITLGKRYSRDGRIKNLPDVVLKNFIGPYQELFEGFTTIAQIKEYMDMKVDSSNERHKALSGKKINLQVGDMVKGISGGMNLLQELMQNGIRAGEFLGTDTHSDATPLDTDFGVILSDNPEESLEKKIISSPASSYGAGLQSFYIVVKHNPDKIEFTRDDPILLSKGIVQEPYNGKIARRNEKDVIRQRINDRSNGKFEPKKMEAFSSKVISNAHYGIRTGIGITDVDYIVTTQYNNRIAYELAMNGTYIPVVDRATEKVLFTPEQYEEIRYQMQGLSYFGTGKFEVDESAYTEQAKQQVDKIFIDGDPSKSISEEDANKKRSAIKRVVEKALYEEMGITVEDRITGDLTNGFVEFIDTGSTGRGTNLPGDGDFDFSLKLDKGIIQNATRFSDFKEALRKVLAVKSSDPKSSLAELGGNFRYKKVDIEGAEMPLDIDITFMPKNGDVTYSTDMCVRDRLNGLKESDPEGYKYVIGNIILAKTKLKEAGLYKKLGSDGATVFGGFGGVGVENWILQNGGSFSKAMETFLEASEKASTFAEFKEIYPIYDFGQNHMSREYSHDSFVKGLSESGFQETKKKFREFMQELTPVKSEQVSMQDLVKNALGSEAIRKSEVDKARQIERINQNEKEGVAIDE